MQKGQLLEQFWSSRRQCIRMAIKSRHPNVATSPRRDVPTSRRWVNQYKSQQYATSRRQCEFCFLIIKSKDGCRFGGIENRTNQGTEIRAAVTSISKRARDLYFSLFWIIEMMFIISHIDIFLFMMF